MPPLPMLRNELKSLEAVQVAPPGRFLVKSVLAISRFDLKSRESRVSPADAVAKHRHLQRQFRE
jgi:hypothetical protein